MSGKGLQDRAKELLVEALKECSADKPIDQITVSELTRAAGINRKTFYYHFDSIRELCLWAHEHESQKEVSEYNADGYDLSNISQLFFQAYRMENLSRSQFYDRIFEYLGLEDIIQSIIASKSMSIIRQHIELSAVKLGLSVTEEDRRFLSDFILESFMLMSLHQLRKERDWTAEQLSRWLSIIWEAAIPACLSAFAADTQKASAVHWKSVFR